MEISISWAFLSLLGPESVLMKFEINLTSSYANPNPKCISQGYKVLYLRRKCWQASLQDRDWKCTDWYFRLLGKTIPQVYLLYCLQLGHRCLKRLLESKTFCPLDWQHAYFLDTEPLHSSAKTDHSSVYDNRLFFCHKTVFFRCLHAISVALISWDEVTHANETFVLLNASIKGSCCIETCEQICCTTQITMMIK